MSVLDWSFDVGYFRVVEERFQFYCDYFDIGAIIQLCSNLFCQKFLRKKKFLLRLQRGLTRPAAQPR